MELKIDIDRMRKWKAIHLVNFRLRWIDYYFKIFPAKIWIYKTHKGFHFYIDTNNKFNDFTIVTILFQSLLGSDWLRELRNFKRYDDGMVKNWNLMFDTKFTMHKGRIKTLSQEKFVMFYVLKKGWKHGETTS